MDAVKKLTDGREGSVAGVELSCVFLSSSFAARYLSSEAFNTLQRRLSVLLRSKRASSRTFESLSAHPLSRRGRRACEREGGRRADAVRKMARRPAIWLRGDVDCVCVEARARREERELVRGSESVLKGEEGWR